MTDFNQTYEEFEQNGVAVLKQVLTPEDLEPAITDIEAWIDRKASRLLEKGEITSLYEGEPFNTRYARLFEQSKNIGYGLDIMYILTEGLFTVLSNPKLLRAIEPLVGPEISCNPIQHIRAKPPSRLEQNAGPSFHNVPWHQDAGVMMAEAENSNILTCWIPLVDVTEEMGCLRALPECTGLGYIPHINEGETMIDPDHLPSRDPISLTCEVGDIIIMNRFTPHSSTPNKTELCRWSLDLRFQTTGHHTGRTAHPDFVMKSDKLDLANFSHWRETWIDHLENPRGFAGHRIQQL